MPSALATALMAAVVDSSSSGLAPKYSRTSFVCMCGLFGTPNDLSIGVAKHFGGILVGVPTEPSTILGRRLYRIRAAAGYGGERKAAEFARQIGITPASLHDLESGKSRQLGGKAWQG